MAAITVAHYQSIESAYTNAQRQIQGVTDYYYDAAYEVLLIDVFDPELDLLQPFLSAYSASQTVYNQPSSSVVAAVIALQQHVISKARTDSAVDPSHDSNRFTNINAWIDAGGSNGYLDAAVGRAGDVDTSFKVSAEFADLSAKGGYDIDPLNIA